MSQASPLDTLLLVSAQAFVKKPPKPGSSCPSWLLWWLLPMSLEAPKFQCCLCQGTRHPKAPNIHRVMLTEPVDLRQCGHFCVLIIHHHASGPFCRPHREPKGLCCVQAQLNWVRWVPLHPCPQVAGPWTMTGAAGCAGSPMQGCTHTAL